MDFTAVADNLKKKGFRVSVFSTSAEAAMYLDSQIDGVGVGIGGSMTVNQIGLLDLLKKHNEVFWHWDGERTDGLTPDEIRTRAALCDVYISSANGLSETGEIVNIDGTGNRLAGTLYGHSRVYYVVGRNKIMPTLEKAMWRARNVASPINARRLKRNTPCAVHADRCYDCSSPERICKGFLVVERPLNSSLTEVVLIDEDLGA